MLIGRGFLYLVAVMDWASRAVLSWQLSNTQDTAFCVEALESALAGYGRPEIFNTDQGSQFTSHAFTSVLRRSDIRISMDGRGRWMDNVFIERLWRSLKYEDVYLKGYADGWEARAGIAEWMTFYNNLRPHQGLEGPTPMAVWRAGVDEAQSRLLPTKNHPLLVPALESTSLFTGIFASPVDTPSNRPRPFRCRRPAASWFRRPVGSRVSRCRDHSTHSIRGRTRSNHQAIDTISKRSGEIIWDARLCSVSDTCRRGSENRSGTGR